MTPAGLSNSTRQLLHRIQGEYLEMPGLRLTPRQAQRLWGLDTDTCADLLETLVSAKFLIRTADGRYTRLTDGGLLAPPLRRAKVEPPTAGRDRRRSATGDPPTRNVA